MYVLQQLPEINFLLPSQAISRNANFGFKNVFRNVFYKYETEASAMLFGRPGEGRDPGD